ncbi:MAG: mechanosensitive ion channel, partial [Clostridia bacterium]|nr:mechanosensitive ion channel [Clostridia bacterium]
FGEKIEEFASTTLLYGVIRVAVAILLIIFGNKLINFIMGRIRKSREKKNIDKTAKSFLLSFLNLALKIGLVILAILILGVPMSSIAAVIASAGVTVGLALQGGLSNLAGGIILLFTKPFSVGDYITIESENAQGTVTEIGVMYTTLVTFENIKIVVPNGKVTSATVADLTYFPTRRMDMTFSVSYSSDIDKVKKVLNDIAENDPRILNDPAPLTTLEKHGESALVFMIRWWLKSSDYWTVYFYLPEKIKKAFDENGIVIPFPQLDVHFDGEKTGIKINNKKEEEE